MLTVHSSSLKLTRRPALAPTVVNPAAPPTVDFTMSSNIQIVGTVVFHGNAGDAGTGWKLGFVQAEWIETNWAVYRGQTERDGSVFLQRARPPARPSQACFDCLQPGALFYGTGAGTQLPTGGATPLPFVATLPDAPVFPLTVQVIHSDLPSDNFPTTIQNGTTGKINFISEAQLEFFFCVSMMLVSPTGQRHFLQSVYWNINWQNSFHFVQPNPTPSIRAPTDSYSNKANVGHVIAGDISDKRFANILRTGTGPTCNQMAATAEANPNVRETRGWDLFNVTR